jgi:hypothetical protein
MACFFVESQEVVVDRDTVVKKHNIEATSSASAEIIPEMNKTVADFKNRRK